MTSSSFPFRKLRWIAAVALFGVLGHASGARAHNSLTSSEPIDGVTLDASPATWSLTFTGDVPLDSASGEIVRSDGSRAALPPPTHGASTSIIVFTLPGDLAGDVTGRWRLVGTDGHVITGRVQFTVTGVPEVATEPSVDSGAGSEVDVPGTVESVTSEPPLGDASPEESALETPVSESEATSAFADPTPESFRWVLQIVAYLGLIVIGGLVFTELVLARGILRRPRATLALEAGALALFVSAAVKTLIQVADINAVSLTAAFRHLGTVFDTTAGSMLVVRTVIGFVLLMVALTLDQRPLGTRFVRLMGGLVILHIVTMPFTGHSRSMRWPALGVPADIVHLIGITVWAGGLLALVAFVMPAAHSGNSVTAYVRFSSYASWAVIAIVVTGFIQTLRLHESPTSLIDSSHGVIVGIKVVLVAAMLAVGWWSRKLLVSDETTSDSDLRTRLIRITAIETGIGVAVIGLSAALVRATFSS